MKIYLLINGVLGVSYLAFCVGERLVLSRVRGRLLRLVRVAQAVLCSAVALPVVMSLVPRESLAPLPDSVRAPLAEMAEAMQRSTASQRGADGRTSTSLVPPNVPARVFDLSGIPWLVVLILGCALYAGRRGYLAWHLRSLLRRATPLRSVGRVLLCVSAEIGVPFSVHSGRRAWAVFPESLLENAADFKIAVRHELQHHRQRDTVWALFEETLAAFFFWNPGVYLWRRKIHDLQELACDEAVLSTTVSPEAYGLCLLRVAEAAMARKQVAFACAGMAGGFRNRASFKSFLRKRIEMLEPSPTYRGSGFIFFALALGCVLSIGTLTYATNTVLAKAEKRSDEIAPGTISADPAIQKIAETALTAALKRHKASLGFVVVSDPFTGRILAVANEDNLEKAAARTPHWALGLRLGPASITKVIIAAAAVEANVARLSDRLQCGQGKYVYDGKTFQDWKAFGELTVEDTVVHSSNICGIKLGERLGASGVSNAFAGFGFGEGGTAEDFPEARPGVLPHLSQASEPAFVASVSTGYDGVLTSPVEIVQAIGAIANGGQLMRPQSKPGMAPKVVRRVLSEKNARAMRGVLAEVVTRGTASKAGSKLYKLAGKTATGYSHTRVGHDSLGGESNVASFVGFGPLEKPRIVIYAVVENPTDGHGVHGAEQGAPLFREVAEKVLQYLKVPTEGPSS